MRLFRTPIWLHRWFSDYTWRVTTKDKHVYLSFDDGPDPIVTPFVLSELARYKAKAVFFCVGDNLEKYPETVNEILRAGHIIANHTQNHLKGWETPIQDYIENTEKCQSQIPKNQYPCFFRPPYGRIKGKQAKGLIGRGYQIIMWDILTYDYDATLNVKWAIKKIVQRTRKGSIVVFHDSQKAFPQLKQLLPLYLKQLSDQGYQFPILTST